MNSRTSDLPDSIADDNSQHMQLLYDDYINDTGCTRFSQDKGKTNAYGHCLLDVCKETGLRILNGRCGVDKGVGKYTFIGRIVAVWLTMS